MESDAQCLSTLQSQLDRLNERRKELTRQLAPVRKRLLQYMDKHHLSRLQCVNYVLVAQEDEGADNDDPQDGAVPALFTKERVTAFLSNDQLKAYCKANARPRKRKRRVVCQRDVIDVAETDDEDAEGTKTNSP